MNKLILISGIFTVAVTAIITACNSSSGKTTDPLPKKTKEEELIQRGSYLVTVGGCDDCHSPKIMGPNGPEIDMERRLSGFPSSRPIPTYNSELIKKGMIQFNEDLTSSAGPWGVSFSANLTSDPTGASSWPLENFKYALRHGKLKGLKESRDLLPPMPWFNFAKMTDEDLEAVYTYLKTIKPVQNIVPGPKSPDEVK
ncbi:MAG TPA: c-type cytochrome [Chitinophagaceae bacterium]|nr:c-type cytochrome [Chitinophagaceae bacterium]